LDKKVQGTNEWLDCDYPMLIVGPCAVESYEMMEKIAEFLVSRNINVIRAGAYKPRTSPSDFQGLGDEGIRILDAIRKKYNVKIVSEIVDVRHIEMMCGKIDVLQVGSRNMYNYELLKELGKLDYHILLKRGLSATIAEFVCAAEYIVKGGNKKLALCERGVRSYDRSTRNLLDLSCVAIIKKETEFNIIVDISHSLGRKDIFVEMSKAALAAGADGIMVEAHHNPKAARSDSKQQMSLEELDRYLEAIVGRGNYRS